MQPASVAACESKARGESTESATMQAVNGRQPLNFGPMIQALIKLGSAIEIHPGSSGTRFITWYDYRHALAYRTNRDRVFFRPLLGWATAWSFDRLRLWLEKGILPEVSRDRAFVYALSRPDDSLCLAVSGLIPKLIYRNADET